MTFYKEFSVVNVQG